MKFRTRMSHDNRLLFVYENGNVKQTRFVEVAYFGDSYVLARGGNDVFYTLLDLEGNETRNLNIIHRFQNGLLLTYSSFEKKYTSSDNISYSVNYNTYSVFNHDTGKTAVVGVVQSDSIPVPGNDAILDTKCRKVAVKDFLNRPIYCFKDFIFSEILDYQFIVVGSFFDFSKPINSNTQPSFDFEAYKNKRIWGLVDILSQGEYHNETDISKSIYANLTFKETEFKLLELMPEPEMPYIDDYQEKNVYNDVQAEFNMYSNWRKKNRWQMVLSKMLSVATN